MSVKLEDESGKLGELKYKLGKMNELKDEVDELLSLRMSWVSWMS